MNKKVNEGYVNEGSDIIEIPAHSPGTPKSFPSNMQICEPNNTGVTSPTHIFNSINTVGFLPDEVDESTMVTWHTRKMRQMTVFLVFFVIIALVMTGLFVWRTVFFDNLGSGINNCNDKICTTSPAITPKPKSCRQHAKPKQFKELPQQIKDVLLSMEKELKAKSVKSSLANVVYMDEVIWSHFHGNLDPESSASKPVNEHSLYPVASVTKVLTALMAFKLYENKTITTLDDRFIKYEPQFRTRNRIKSNKIVIRELASHMAGLPREAPCYPDKAENFCPYNNSVILDRLKAISLLWAPGLKPSYSNLGFGLLGNGLASHLNTTYHQWMKENLFEPLGMNNSTFEPVSKNRDNIVIGYDIKPRNPKNWGWLDPSAGLFTSVSDLAKVEIELFKSLDKKGFLSPVYAHEFFSPDHVSFPRVSVLFLTVAHEKTNEYGNNRNKESYSQENDTWSEMAYMLSDEQSLVGMPWEMSFNDGYLLRKKNGGVYGYISNMYIVPELKLAFNVMNTGSSMGTENLFKKLVNAFNSVLKENATKSSVPPNVGSFTGIYKPRSDKDGVPGLTQAEVTYSNNKMYLSFTFYGIDSPFQLNYLSNTTFEIWDRPLQSCLEILIRGFDTERVYFHPLDQKNNLSGGFKIFGIHPRGWTYFERNTTDVVN